MKSMLNAGTQMDSVRMKTNILEVTQSVKTWVAIKGTNPTLDDLWQACPGVETLKEDIDEAIQARCLEVVDGQTGALGVTAMGDDYLTGK